MRRGVRTTTTRSSARPPGRSGSARHRARRAATAAIAAALLGAGSGLPGVARLLRGPGPAQAATATNIQCNGQPYISRDAWRLSNADTASATFAEGPGVATATSPTRYNALGFNVKDGNVYGIYGGTAVNGTGNQLTRITPSGTIQNLGPVTGLPTGISYQAGDVDENGIMWVKPVNVTTALYRIDLNVTPYKATAVTLSAAVGIEDLAYNPVNGLLYGWTYNPVGRIAEINPTTGAVVQKNPTGLDTQSNGESVWFDALGNMHVAFRDVGDVWQFSNLASATPTATKISDRNAALAATDNSMDAAGCPYAPTIDKAFSPTTLSSAVGSTATLTFTLRNVLDGALAVDLTDTLPTGLVYDAASLVVGNGTGTPNAYGGTAGLIVTGITLPPNGTVTVTVTVRTTGNNVGGTLNNQARLTVPTTQTDPLVPTGVKGATIFSNNPAATLINEPTPISVYDSVECSARWYYWHGTGVANGGGLGWWNTATTPWAGGGTQLSALAGGPFRIMEYNVQDGFFYTLPTTGNTLFSVDAGERTRNLGAVTGLPASFVVAGAAFSESGALYVKAGGATNVIYRIDVTTRVATAITLSSSINVQDLAVDPFNSNQAYSITTAGQLATINLTTGAVTLKTITGGANVTDAEALWFDSSGTLYTIDQDSNDVYAITNLTAATATATRVSGDRAGAFGVSATIDGTSCPYVPLARKSWSPASITPPATTTLTIDVINPLDVAVDVDVTDMLPSTLVQYVAGTLVVSNGTGTPNAYGGTQSLAVAGVTLPANGTTTLTITVSNPLPLGGVADNQATVTVPAGQPGVPATLADVATVSDNPATTTVFQDKTRLVMSGPLPCDNRAYIMQQRATDTWGSMYGLDQTVADPTLELLYPQSPTTGANVSPASEFNGIGYNVVDGFIYGSVGTVQAGLPASIGAYDIVRVDGAGNAVYINVTRPAAVNTADATWSHVGDITAGGLFYRPLDYPTGGDGIEIIDLNNINYGTTPPSVSSTVIRLSQQFPIGFADWAFNPTDGRLYASAITSTSPNVERLVRINPVANGTATLVGTFSTTGNGAGAVWFDAFGSFYAYHNSNAANASFGSIVRWDDPNTATPKPTLVDDDFPATAGNDGARCAYFPGFTKDVTPRIAPAGAVVTYTYVIRNGYPAGGQNLTADFVDTMADGRTYVPGTVTINGQVSAGTAALSAGNTQLDIPDIVVGPQQSATITIQVQTDPNTPDLPATVYNQATINGAVVQPVVSDYPGTEDVLDDATPLVLVEPLECTDEAFLTHNVTPFSVDTFDRLSGEQTTISPDTELVLNSLGYNPLDGLLYSLNATAATGTSNDLQAIDANGNVVSLGDVTGLPDTQNYNGGTFDTQGRLWVKPAVASSTVLYAIDVATRTATQYATSVAISNFGDYAYNPLDGKIYGFNWTSDAAASIVAIDISAAPTTKPTTITTFNPPDTVDSLAQSQWIDGNGNLFIRANTDGEVWMIEPLTAAAQMLSVGTAATGGLDGASCPRPELAKDVNPGQVTAGELVTYTFRITNPTPGTLSLGLLDNQDSGRTFVAGTLGITDEGGATVPAASYTVNAYGGTGTLDIDSLEVPSGNVFTATVQVLTDIDTPGGTLLNQAQLTDLAARYGTVLSDFPDTLDTFDDPTPLVVLGAQIDVEKSHVILPDNGQPGAADVGDTVVYSYVVTNVGEVPLSEITVSDLVEGTVPLTANCPVSTLAPGASTTCTAPYLVTQGDIDAQGYGDNDLDNVVTANGTTAPGGVVSDSDIDVTPLAQAAPELVIDKAYAITTDGGTPGIAEAGDVITYTYRITNTGAVTLTNVTAIDTHEGTGTPKPGTLVCSNTTLLPNQTGTCTATYTVVQGDVDTITDGFLDDVVRVTATSPSGTLTANDAESVPLPAAQPSITVDKTYTITTDGGGPGVADPNDVVTYSFFVVNNGNAALENIDVADIREIAPQLVVSCPATTLAPGESMTCTAPAVTVTAADALAEQTDTDSRRSINDVATARGTEEGTNDVVSDTDEEAVPVAVLEPIYSATKTSTGGDGDGFVTALEQITYTITVTNTGLVEATNVPVIDPIPAYTSFFSATNGGTLNTTTTPAQVEWTIPSIAANGGTAVVTFTVTADLLIPDEVTSIGNQATIDGSTPTCADPDEDSDPLTCDPTIDYIAKPSINVEKSHVLGIDGGQAAVADVGDRIDYSYRVTNTGNVPLDPITVTDSLEGGTPLAADCGPVTSLAVGASVTCTLSHIVDQPEFDARGGGDSDLDNTVEATGVFAILTVTDTDDDVVQLAQPANGIAVDKSYAITGDVDGDGLADAGDTVTYTYVITNTGTVTLTGVTATDDHEGAGGGAPGVLTCAPTTLAPNATATCSATYQVVQPDIDGQADTSLDDTVTATGTPPSGPAVSGTDSESVPLPLAEPAINVDKTWVISPDLGTPGVVDAGDTVHYSYKITNNGNVTLNVVGGIDTHEVLGAAAITCQTAALSPGQSTTCISQWTATATQLFAQQSDADTPRAATDSVTVSGTAPDGDIVRDTDDEVVPMLTLPPAIDVEKDHALANDLDGDGFADEGDMIQYAYTVRNVGQVDLSGLVVTDVLEGGVPFSADCGVVTGLAVGASTMCFSTHVITAAEIGGWGGGDGDLDNTVTASANSVNGSVSDSDDDVVQLAQAAPGLSVEKTAAINPDLNGNGIADQGDTVVYAYAVTNTGLLPLTLVNATDEQEGAGNVTLTCPDPTLAPNETVTCDSTWHVVTASDISGQNDRSLDDVLTVTATDGSTTLLGVDSESVPVAVNGPAIAIDKTWVIDPDGGTTGVLDAGDTVTYTYRVTNNGTVTLSNVAVVDTQEIAGDVLASCVVTTLAPGQSTTCTTTFPATDADVLFEQTDADTRNSMTDVATATAQDPIGSYVADTDDETVPVAAMVPAIDVEKTHALTTDTDNDGFADVGEVVTYSYHVTNTGTADLTALVVADVLEGVAVTNEDCAGVATLAVGASATCTSSYQITQTDIDGAGRGDGDLDNTVTASASSINGPVSDVDDDVVQLAQAAPGLSVDKEWAISTDGNSNGIADAGDEITYTYVLTNAGNVTLTNVGAIDDHESAGATTLTCAPTTLAPGESATCNDTTYTVTQPDIDLQADPTLDDVVTATGTPPVGDDVSATDSESVPLPAPAPAITVDKTWVISPDGGAAGFVDAGDEVDYTYVVTNNGNVTLTSVGVLDTHEIGGGLTASCLVTTLAPGESTTCSTSYTASTNDVYLEQTDADTMRAITDVATASGTAPGPNVVTDTDDEAVPVVVLPPAIDVEKGHAFAVPNGDVDGDGFADAGDTVTYTYVVTNTGGVDLTGVDVADVLEGVAVPGEDCQGVATLAVNTSMTCTSSYMITQAEIDGAGGGDGDLDNTVTVSGVSVNGTASDSDDDVVQLAQRAPGLVVDKTRSITTDAGTIGVGNAGDVVTYGYTITNTGNVTLTNVGATDVHESAGSIPLTCAATTLAPGASTTCNATTYIVTQGNIDNPPGPSLDDVVTATGTPPSGPNVSATDSESVPLPVPSPAVTVDKTYTIGPDGGAIGVVDAGDTVTYTYLVTNNGNVTLTDVGVLDTHETGGQLTATCLVTTLAPGDSTLCSAPYVVTAADVLAEQSDADTEGAITDVATASGTAPNGNVVRDTDEEAVPVAVLPGGIDVEKSHAFATGGDVDGDGFADAGDTLTYTYVVTNTGQLDLTNVVVEDVLEGSTVTVDCQGVDTIGVGGSITCTSSYTVLPTDIAGFGGGDLDLDNTVTARGDTVNGQVSDGDTDVVPLGTGTTVSDAGIGVQKSWAFAPGGDVNGNGLGDEGDTVTYTYVVTNSGAEVLTSLVVDDNHEGAGTPEPDLITCPDTALDPNESVTCTATYVLVAGDFPGDDPSLDDTVVATAERPGGSELHGVDSESVPLVVTAPNTPAIVLDKEWTLSADADGDGIGDAGDVVAYTFRIVNNGTVELTNVGVTDVHEGSPQLAIGCPVTTLAPGASTTCTAAHTVTPAETMAEQTDADSPLLLADVATAAGAAPNGNIVRDTDEEAVPVPFLAAAIDVEKSHAFVVPNGDLDGDGFADAGDIVRYEYVVTNTGTNAELTDLLVRDVLEGGPSVDADCGGTTTLAAGESVTCFTLHTVTPGEIAGFGGGDLDLDNTVTAEATSDVGDVSDSDTDVVPLGTGTALSDAGIGVQKSWAFTTDTNDNGLGDAGDVVTYTYIVTNTGSEGLTNLVVDDNHEGAGSPAPDVITCSDTTLDPGESVSCTATYVLVAGDFPGDDFSLDNTVVATAQSDTGTLHGVDSESVPLAVTTPNTPAITLDKEWTFVDDADNDGIADAGDEIAYSFRIVNNGTVDLTNVAVTDITEGSPQLTIGCSGVTALLAGTSALCTASYTVTAADVLAEQADPDSPLLLADVATVAGAAPNGNIVRDTDEEGVPVPLQYIAISSVKTVVDASGDGLASPGEVLTYTILITNDGTVDAVDQPFVDLLDPNTTFNPGSVEVGGDPQPAHDPTAGFPVTIPAESSVTVRFTVTVDSPLDPSPMVISNQSTIGDEPSCADVTDPCEPTTIPVGRPGITLDKHHVWLVDRGQAGAGDAGDLVRYDYVVTNTGQVTLAIGLDDDHEGDGSLSVILCPHETLAAGESMTCTATYTVTQGDVDTFGGGDGIIPNDALVTATPLAGPALTDPAHDEITVSTSTPQLAVDKEYTIGPDAGLVGLAEQGDTVNYTYVITNTGNVTLTNVALVDDHEGSTAAVVPSCGATTLAPGAQTSCTATYVVTAADQTLADGHIDDLATATGAAPDNSTVSSGDEEAVPVVVAAPAITVDKRWTFATPEVGATGLADAGDVVEYEYTVTNNGNVALTAVSLADDHDGAGSFTQPVCPVTTLAAGASTTCTATYTVTQADVDAGNVIPDVATATGTPPVGAAVTDIDGEAVPITPALPAVELDKVPAITTDGGTLGVADAGDVITYTYTLTNTGNVTLTGIAVTDNHSGSGVLSPIVCPVTTLPPGASTDCTATYTVTAEDVAGGGTIVNVATVTANPPKGGPVTGGGEAEVPVVDVAALTVEKSATFTDTASAGTPGSLDPGEVAVYQYVVRNTGNIPVDGIVVTDVHEGSSTAVVPSCPATSLLPGQQMVCTATYTVTEADMLARGDGDGTLDDTATAAGTTRIGPVTSPPDGASLPLTEPRPAVTLEKRAVGTTTSYQVGQTVGYEIVVTNTGNVTLTNVAIVDVRIPDLDCGDFDGSLAPGETVTCTGSLVVTQADADAGRVVNSATVTADPLGGSAVTAGDTAEVQAVPPPPPTTVPPPPTTTPPSPSELPATGGNSTPTAGIATVLTLIGALLVLVAVTARRRRRRPAT